MRRKLAYPWRPVMALENEFEETWLARLCWVYGIVSWLLTRLVPIPSTVNWQARTCLPCREKKGEAGSTLARLAFVTGAGQGNRTAWSIALAGAEALTGWGLPAGSCESEGSGWKRAVESSSYTEHFQTWNQTELPLSYGSFFISDGSFFYQTEFSLSTTKSLLSLVSFQKTSCSTPTLQQALHLTAWTGPPRQQKSKSSKTASWHWSASPALISG